MSYTGSASGQGGVIVPKQKDKTVDYAATEATIGSFDSDDTLMTFIIDVHTIYNSSNPVASIGTDADHEKYLTEDQCYLLLDNEYRIQDTIVLTGAETIKVFIDPDGATVGSLTASVEYN